MTVPNFSVILVALGIIVGNLNLSHGEDARCSSEPDKSCGGSGGSITAWYFNNETQLCVEYLACNQTSANNTFNSTMYCQQACIVGDPAHMYAAAMAASTATTASIFPAADPVVAAPQRQKRSTTKQHFKEQEGEDHPQPDEEGSSVEVKTKQTDRVDSKRRLVQTKNKGGATLEVSTEIDQTSDYQSLERDQKGDEVDESAHVELNAGKLKKINKTPKKKTLKHKNADRDSEKKKKRVSHQEANADEERRNHKDGKPRKRVAASGKSRHHSGEHKKTHDTSSASAAERKTAEKMTSTGSASDETATPSSQTDILNIGKVEESTESPSANPNRAPSSGVKGGEVVEEEFEIVSENIKKIIVNPSYVFSYSNITGEDLVSLQEMVFQSDVGAMQLLEKGEADKLEAERKRAVMETRSNELVKVKVLKTEDALQGKPSDEQAVETKTAPASP